MRICFLINHLGGGGAERALQCLANHYCRTGHQVTILLLETWERAYQFDPRIQISQIMPFSPQVKFRDLLIPFQALMVAARVRRLKPDFVLSFLQRSNFVNVLSRLLGSGSTACISEQIATDSAFDTKTAYGWTTLNLVRTLYPLASKIFCASTGVQVGLERLGVDCSAASVVSNPIDEEEVGEAVGVRIPEFSDRPVIVSLGRLASQKNHHCLIEAAAPLLQEFDARLLIIGQGELEESLRQQATQLGVRDKVRLHGWCAKPYELLKGSSIFALSSRFEGFGNVIVEAMACGLPIVSTDCPSGPAEILENGKYGLLCPNEDAVALRQHLRELLLRPELRAHYSGLSLQRARDYGVTNIAARYLELARKSHRA